MDSIEGSGYPIGFPLDDTKADPLFLGGAGEAVVTTEARMMAGHQKEAIVHEGQGGPRWRLTSDEGLHLGGADVAPFPLGFFNAGLHGEVMARSAVLGADPSEIDLSIQNFYWMTGSFAKGTGEGFSDPPAVIQTGGANHLEQAVAGLHVAREPVQVVGIPGADGPHTVGVGGDSDLTWGWSVVETCGGDPDISH